MNEAIIRDDLVGAVRGGDYDRFLAIQLTPAVKRPALYAIVAFHIEVASIAELVSETLIGHIRLAWWREALEEIEAGKAPRNHPVVLALADMYREHPRVFALLYEMIEARAADIDSSLIEEEASWMAYLDHTAGALHMAMATVVDEACARAQEAMIRDQAKAYAMIGLVRAVPFMASQGWMRFPKARCDAHQLTSLAPSEALQGVLRDITHDAREIIARTSGNCGLKFLKALVALATLHERQLQRIGFDPYRLGRANLPSVWQVMRVRYF